jgi:hypothetical protein
MKPFERAVVVLLTEEGKSKGVSGKPLKLDWICWRDERRTSQAIIWEDNDGGWSIISAIWWIAKRLAPRREREEGTYASIRHLPTIAIRRLVRIDLHPLQSSNHACTHPNIILTLSCSSYHILAIALQYLCRLTPSLLRVTLPSFPPTCLALSRPITILPFRRQRAGLSSLAQWFAIPNEHPIRRLMMLVLPRSLRRNGSDVPSRMRRFAGLVVESSFPWALVGVLVERRSEELLEGKVEDADLTVDLVVRVLGEGDFLVGFGEEGWEGCVNLGEEWGLGGGWEGGGGCWCGEGREERGGRMCWEGGG